MMSYSCKRPSDMELLIDTSTRRAGVGISEEGLVRVELAWRSERNHTVELAPTVVHALKLAGAKPGDLSAVLVALGPGTFSGVRVGLAFAKGMALALHTPILGLST